MLRPLLSLLAAFPLLAYAAEAPTPAEVSVCFSPGPASCADLIAGLVDAARTRVRMQAYWFTSLPILHAVAAAKRRGLDVAVILDKSQDRHASERSRYTGATYLANSGVPVWIDDTVSIAHNKVIILDDRTVITGSFNFSKAADTRNAENVAVVESATVAAWYERNWEERQVKSRLFGAE